MIHKLWIRIRWGRTAAPSIICKFIWQIKQTFNILTGALVKNQFGGYRVVPCWSYKYSIIFDSNGNPI